jgi:chemotaxis protein CheD
MVAPAPTVSAPRRTERKVIVGVGAFAVSNDRSVVLSTYSLGSCLGIAVYDPVVHAAGLLHVMLPDSTINAEKASQYPGMFVDTGIPALFRALYQLRAEKHRIHICVAGGAKLMDDTGFFNIGGRNFEALNAILDKHQLAVDARRLGGLVSRTMHVSVETGEVRLKASGQSEEILSPTHYVKTGPVS